MNEITPVHMIDEIDTMPRSGGFLQNGNSPQSGRTRINAALRDYCESLKNLAWGQSFVIVKTVQKPKLHHIRGKGWFLLCPITGQTRTIGQNADEAVDYFTQQTARLNGLVSEE